MGFVELPFAYLIWHYTLALRQIVKIWTGFVWYLFNLFSIVLLLRTLFSPWKRMTEAVGGGGGLEKMAEAVVINILSRFVGLTIRIPIILVGCLSIVLSAVGLILVYLVWVLLPFILFTLLTLGVTLIYA